MKDISYFVDFTRRDCTNLFITELDDRVEFDLFAILALGVNFGCNLDMCTQTICPIPPA